VVFLPYLAYKRDKTLQRSTLIPFKRELKGTLTLNPITIRAGNAHWELDLTVRSTTNNADLTKAKLDAPRAALDQADQQKNTKYKQMVEDAHANGKFYALSCTVTGVRGSAYNDFLRVLRRHYADGATRNVEFPRTFTCPDYVSYIIQATTVSILNETAYTIDAVVEHAIKSLPTFRL
jgi:hypothetical protein